MNIVSLLNGVITQGPIGLFLFGVPLLLNAGIVACQFAGNSSIPD